MSTDEQQNLLDYIDEALEEKSLFESMFVDEEEFYECNICEDTGCRACNLSYQFKPPS
jgi:hypothetical protein